MSPKADIVLCAVSLTSVFFFSGIIFGWAPLQSMLIREGQYSELCTRNSTHLSLLFDEPSLLIGKNETTACTAQSTQLDLVFTLASSALSLVSLPAGMFLDRHGPRAAICLSAMFTIGGLLLVAFSESKKFDAFIPGMVALAIGGVLTMLAAFPVSFRFSTHQPAVLASISCLFDGSSLVFAVFNIINVSQPDMTRSKILLIYTVLSVLIYASLIAAWTMASKDHEAEAAKAEVKNHSDKEVGSGDNVEIADMSISNQLRTFEFGVIVIYASLQMLRANCFIGFNGEMMASLGDKDGFYTEVFGWVLPGGIIFVPVIDFSIMKLGLTSTLHLTNAFGIAYGILSLVKHLTVQLATFIFFTLFRAFLYATMSTFIAQIFGLKTLGRITGFVFTTSALVSLLQYPLQALTAGAFDGNPRWSAVILLFLVVPIAIVVFAFQRRQGMGCHRPSATRKRQRYDSVQSTHGEDVALINDDPASPILIDTDSNRVADDLSPWLRYPTGSSIGLNTPRLSLSASNPRRSIGSPSSTAMFGF